MSKKCCVTNCNERRTDDTILHLFPHPEKDIDRFNSWRNAVGKEIIALKPEIVFKYRRICHKHFEPNYYTRSKRLSANAVPTLCLSGTIPTSGQQPSQDYIILQDVAQRLSSPPQYLFQSASLQHPTNGMLKQTRTSYALPSKDVDAKNKHVIGPDIAVLESKIRLLQQAKDKAVKKLKNYMKLSENPVFQGTLRKFSSTASIFTKMQFREAGKRTAGRRFTKKEKLISLALFKQGPRAYKWLSKYFVLPSPLTLNRMLTEITTESFLNT